MAKKKARTPKFDIGYNIEATPRTVTSDGIPVFCSFDEIVPIERSIPNPKNPNQHNNEQIALLGGIIKANGWRAPITISRRSGFIVKGHGRRLAAMHIGSGFVPVDYQEYASEAEEWADLIADNRLAELSTLDTEMLAELINELDTEAIPLTLTGYTEEDLAELLSALESPDSETDIDMDEIPEETQPPMSRPGDLWHLGQHRLICGDATDPEIIARLMDGEKAQMVNTDPPYGVGYESQSGKFDKIRNDDLSDDDLMAGLLIPAFKNYVEYTDPGAAFYIWHASSTRRNFEDAMIAAGLKEKQYIIWVKNLPVLGHADYQWAHEPCFYAEKAGESALFYGDRSQKTAWKVVFRGPDQSATVLTGGIVLTDGAGGKIYLTDKVPKGKKFRHIRLRSGKSVSLYSSSKATDIWEVAKETATEHPTQKPVELAIRAIDNSSQPGDLVADFFAGSGSTMIGAELTSRRSCLCELDPIHCDTIVRRYFRMTGNADISLERGGKMISFHELESKLKLPAS